MEIRTKRKKLDNLKNIYRVTVTPRFALCKEKLGIINKYKPRAKKITNLKFPKGWFLRDAIEELFWIPKTTFQRTDLKRTFSKDILIIKRTFCNVERFP